MTEAQSQAQQQGIYQQTEQLAAIALERVIDAKLQAKLAKAQGIAVTDADIDARLVTEATSPESRHAWVIEVEPETDAGRDRTDRGPEDRREDQGRRGPRAT